MNLSRLAGITLVAVLFFIPACTTQTPMDTQLASSIKRFAPTVITADTSRLSAGNKAALKKLIAAARLMDSLYLRQTWSGTMEVMKALEADTTLEGRETLRYFRINMGPWSGLDHDSAFVKGVPPRPPQATFYPDDMRKEEFTEWAAKLPNSEKEKATGFFYVIRRDSAKKLYAVTYSTEYRDLLGPAAGLLREAASLTDDPSLKAFLEKRADAFLSNDYYDSDLAWMDLDSPIDVTIGPYESYMDRLFNYKAAFEAYISLRDDAETARLAHFAGRLQEIEDHLPIDPAFRNPKLGALAPVRVVDEVAIGGEALAGVQAAAYNLPNDERIVKEKGSKRVLMKNVQEAKFTLILKPIAGVVLAPAQQPLVAFDPFFTHILAHELMHGLGPHNITLAGRKTTVRHELKELYSAFEEAKADISGLFALQYLIDAGALDKTLEQQMYVTFLTGVFRSVRFGTNEAHSRGMAMQFNYLSDEGAYVYDEQAGTYSVDIAKMKGAVRKLTGEIMTVQATGDYGAAKRMLGMGVIRPPMQRVLDRLSAIPVDIAPEFPLAE
jgi:hypothetical protein